MNVRVVVVFIVITLLNCTSVMANNHQMSEHGPHHLSLFLGSTHLEGDATGFTTGIDYEYRVNHVLGVGSVVEYAGNSVDAWTVLAVADVHFVSGLIMQIGPGFEHRHHHDVLVGRLGVLYEAQWGEYTVSPQLHYDYHEGGHENGIVLGVALGIAF